ncbi:MAG: (2Fe-2S)-binding protein [Deltaproteobacteria bacterium]|nr:(2Fe-2S)-binding protein [Deltaproteobacteria bacterium]
MAITLRVNRQAHTVDCAPNTLLVDVLREKLRLTGTHVGCDTSQCGACTVHVDGRSVKSCTMLAVEAADAEITTIEGLASSADGSSGRSGLADGGNLHPMQAAFQECHGLQCGFCTPGMVMSATDLCRRNPKPTEHEVRHWLEGNLCRCTGYHNIVKAVLAGAEAMGGKAK